MLVLFFSFNKKKLDLLLRKKELIILCMKHTPKRKKTISFNRIQHFGYLSLKDWTKQENSHK